MIEIKNYINGELLDSTIGNYIDIYNPSIGKIFAQCPNSTEADLDNAISSAEEVLTQWSDIDQDERSDFLFRIADIVEDNIDEFAEGRDRAKC